MIALIALTLFASVTLGAEYAEINGNELLRRCNISVRYLNEGKILNDDELAGGTYCLAYISGYVDAEQVSTARPGNKSSFCMPDAGIDLRQTVRIVTKWLTDHPGQLHSTSRVLIGLALKDAFPCRH